MKVLWGLGKGLTLLFWLVVLVNLISPLISPFHLMVNLAGSLLLMTHLVELVLYHRNLNERAHPWRDRLQILVVGIFHLQTIAIPSAAEVRHA
jgi:putative membrane protein